MDCQRRHRRRLLARRPLHTTFLPAAAARPSCLSAASSCGSPAIARPRARTLEPHCRPPSRTSRPRPPAAVAAPPRPQSRARIALQRTNPSADAPAGVHDEPGLPPSASAPPPDFLRERLATLVGGPVRRLLAFDFNNDDGLLLADPARAGEQAGEDDGPFFPDHPARDGTLHCLPVCPTSSTQTGGGRPWRIPTATASSSSSSSSSSRGWRRSASSTALIRLHRAHPPCGDDIDTGLESSARRCCLIS